MLHPINARKGQARKRAKVVPTVAAKPEKPKRNWRAYEAEQKRRYDLEVWFDEDVLKHWFNDKSSYGRQRRPYIYSTEAILSTLGCGALFKYPLRGAEHFTSSLLRLVGRADLKAPDHSTLCRARKRLNIPLAAKLPNSPRVIIFDGTGLKIFGEGEWLKKKHEVSERAKYRRLTICLDYETGQIISHTLMPSDGDGTGEVSQVAPLFEMLPEGTEVEAAIFDQLFDAEHIYSTVGSHGGLPIIIPKGNADYGLHPVRDKPLKRPAPAASLARRS